MKRRQSRRERQRERNRIYRKLFSRRWRPPPLTTSKRYVKAVSFRERLAVRVERMAAMERNRGKRPHERETVNPKKIRRKLREAGVL